MTINSLSDAYFEALGEPRPGAQFSLLDDYRFDVAARWLLPGSVLDVGVYFGDFLKRVRQFSTQIAGTEINQRRVDLANRLIGEGVVKLDFQNGKLRNFEDTAFDNVVCTEVLEHVPDHLSALSEICRVARRRVIITVPFEEKIQSVCCVHCAKYTPHSGHLHSYDLTTFYSLVPPGWVIKKQEHFGKKLTRRLIRLFRLERSRSTLLIRLLEFLPGGKGAWLLIVLDRNDTTSHG